MRPIDADATIADLLTVDPQYETMIDWCCRVLDAQPTVDAIPIEWILNNERMPKEGKGRKAIMDMLEDWRKEHDTAD